MVEPEHQKLTVKKQCSILNISRSAYYYQSVIIQDDEREVTLLQAILGEYKEHPFYGYRKIWRALKDSFDVTLKQVRRLMKKAGLLAIYPGKRTSVPGKGHPKYPYLLRGKQIWLPKETLINAIEH